jgi:hypothetical protein
MLTIIIIGNLTYAVVEQYKQDNVCKSNEGSPTLVNQCVINGSVYEMIKIDGHWKPYPYATKVNTMEVKK